MPNFKLFCTPQAAPSRTSCPRERNLSDSESPNMKLQDAIVLITGANRGIGFAFAEAALARGARKVYAGARSPSSIDKPGLVAVKLDVTSDQDVATAAR